MRILYANDGMNLQDHMFIKFFLDQGHEVHLVSFFTSFLYRNYQRELIPNFLGLPDFDGLEIHYFDLSRAIIPVPLTSVRFYYLYELVSIFVLSSLVKKIKPDVLNGHWLPTYGFFSAMTFYHPFVLTVWGSDILIMPKKSYFTKKRVEFALKRADSVIVDSIVQENAAIELGCDSGKIVRFPWAVDLDKFNPRVSGREIRERLGCVENAIIFFARWHKTVYGLGYLLRVVPQVVRNNPEARFIIGGVGPLTEEYKRFIEENGMSKYVKLVGRILHSKMPEFMAACDIYVSPSLSDGTSAALLEAMASGKPVVVSDIPANNEWVKNGKNGLIVPTRNSSAIASAIITLLNDRKLRIAFGRRNLEIVRKKADLQKSLKKYEKIMLEFTK